MLTRIAREKKKKRNGNNELEFFFFFVATKNRSIDDFSTRRSESSSIGTDLSITKSIYATMNIRPPRRIESCTVNHAQTIIIFALRVRRTKKKNEKRIIKDYLLNEEESIEIRLRVHRELLRIKYIEERKWK